jgi:hypothetical protein
LPLKKGGFRLLLAPLFFQMSDNLGNDAINVAKYIEIRETLHTQAHIVQVSVASRILRLSSLRVVLTAVNLEDSRYQR